MGSRDRGLVETALALLEQRRSSIEAQDQLYNRMCSRLLVGTVLLVALLLASSAFAEPKHYTLPEPPETVFLNPGTAAQSVDRTLEVTIDWDFLREHPERWPAWMSSKTAVPGITGPWHLVDWEDLRARPHIWPPWMMERPTSRAPSETTTGPKRGVYPSGCIECGHSCKITTSTFGRELHCYPPIYEVDEQCEHGHAWVRRSREGGVSYR